MASSKKSSNPDSLFSTNTPDKTRSRNTDVSVSTPEIKPKSSRDPNQLPIKPVKRQIFSSPEKVIKLPERFMILEELFYGLDIAIRVLKLKRSLTSFANIYPKIQCLTNRVLSYGDLAQMKYIYPEAIEVKRVLKYDEVTRCMKPSLHVNLNADVVVVDGTSCGTKYMELKKVFRSKLVEFYKANPEDEIPKELLPDPFNSAKADTVSVDLGGSKLEVGGFDVRMEEMEQEERIVDKVILDSTVSDGSEECLESHTESTVVGAHKLEVEEFDARMEEIEQEQRLVDKVIPDSALLGGTEECVLSHTESSIVATPVKVLSTPSEDLSTPIRLMSATPTLQPSRRCFTMTPGDDGGSVRSTIGLQKCPSRSRRLNFTADESAVKDETSNETDDDSVDEGSNYEAVDASGGDSLLLSMKDKPEGAVDNQHLLKLVDLIHKLFNSTKRSSITKEELVNKLIACQMEITDRKEVEEQLKTMLQLVPDWISESKASSGDSLVRINKMSTAETVRARLEEATTTSQGIPTVY